MIVKGNKRIDKERYEFYLTKDQIGCMYSAVCAILDKNCFADQADCCLLTETKDAIREEAKRKKLL